MNGDLEDWGCQALKFLSSLPWMDDSEALFLHTACPVISSVVE